MEVLQSPLITNKYTIVVYDPNFTYNAPDHFQVINKDTTDESSEMILGDIQFQSGAILEHGVNGVMNEDLIAMVIHRLECFQASQFRCRENALAITKLEEGLMWLRTRTTSREMRGVEGMHKI
jgi:hypothetical protein